MKIEGHTDKTKKIMLNRLAELICKTIGEEHSTKIKIVDCENFLVIKGCTTSKDILDLNEIKKKFVEKFNSESEDFSIGNTIDLIQYDVKLEETTKLVFEFHNYDNLIPTKCLSDFQIEPITFESDFPFGYSYKQGKSLYYYAKHIAFNLQSKHSWDKLTMCISKENVEENIQVYVDSCQTENESIKSSILDAFEFNYTSFEKSLDNSDWWALISENMDPSVVKSLNEDLIIF